MTAPVPQIDSALETAARVRVLAALPETGAPGWAEGRSLRWIATRADLDFSAEWIIERMVASGSIEALTAGHRRFYRRLSSVVGSPTVQYPGLTGTPAGQVLVWDGSAVVPSADYATLTQVEEFRGRVPRDGEDGEDGRRGLPGQQGDTGAAGAAGSTGAPGADGERGYRGMQGEDGEDGIGRGQVGLGTAAQRNVWTGGIDGTDLLDLAASVATFAPIVHTHAASEERGYRGLQGEDGDDGLRGRPGVDGAAGIDGRVGRDGQDGEDALPSRIIAPVLRNVHGVRRPIAVHGFGQRNIPTGKTLAAYVGRMSDWQRSFSLMYHVLSGAVTVTWAECAIAKGAWVPNGGPTLTTVGYADISAQVVTYQFYTKTVTLTAGQHIGPDDGLWLLFGNAATTTFDIGSGSITDTWTGLTCSATMRPSSNIGTGVAFTAEDDKCILAYVE